VQKRLSFVLSYLIEAGRKIDRIAAYAARHAAKNLVKAGLATQCEVQLSYSIGEARPVGIRVATFGSGRRPDDVLTVRVAAHFDLRPGGIMRRFELWAQPRRYRGRFYRNLALYSHVGRLDLQLPWEATDDAEALR
jgi:S-adenosylmethionine synthetase